jgi:DNA-binding NarL/FixJ family response regulator
MQFLNKSLIEVIMKILIVDDSDLIRVRIIALLSGVPGIDIVAEAGNMTEARKFIDELKPDLLLLDIRLPNGSGVELLKNLREKHDSMKIVILTNYPLVQYKEKCLELGADYFFDKSTEFEKVRDAVLKMQHEYSNK